MVRFELSTVNWSDHATSSRIPKLEILIISIRSFLNYRVRNGSSQVHFNQKVLGKGRTGWRQRAGRSISRVKSPVGKSPAGVDIKRIYKSDVLESWCSILGAILNELFAVLLLWDQQSIIL
ncbi:hypothetical protein RND81_02G097100 [Saponaria officinalis]|uniref:Uncharacterized protein n=1 Tax=Saponaria officinalis TaxID=3572 RepID=A0AAW1MT22_SAPOF